MTRRTPRRTARRGFTLLELVIVMSILVILSGVVLARLDVFQVRANKAQGASSMHGISRMVQIHFAANNLYPDRWDSLLTSGGTPGFWTATTINTGAETDKGLHPSLTGSPTAIALGSANAKFQTVAFGASGGAPDGDKQARSLTRMGITTVFDVDTALTGKKPAEYQTVSRSVAAGGLFATLKKTNLFENFYGPGITAAPAGKTVICLGLNRRSTMLGDTLQDIPFYADQDTTVYYNRYICVFEVDNAGGRSRLLGSLASDGDTIEEEVNDYYGN